MHKSSLCFLRRLAVAIAVATATTVVLGALPAASAQRPGGAAPLSAPILNVGHPEAVPGSFIVVLRDGAGAASTAAALHQRYNLDLRFVYTSAIKGFAVRHATAQQLRQLSTDPAVAYIEQDLKVSVASPAEAVSSGEVVSAGEPICFPPPCEDESVQLDPPSWHLDRISQRNLPMDRMYHYPNTGSAVRAYIIDTGIRLTHNDFGGRAQFGFDFEHSAQSDCHGHGTYMAGVLGGRAFGVAKAVRLVSVRVLNCAGSGTYSAVISGVDWVTRDSSSNPGMNVAVMGLGGGHSQALNDAVTRSISAGVHYSVAAGNNSGDACILSPASTPGALTVTASNSADARPLYSNFGTCVDLYAPGVMVTGPWPTSDTATNTLSGTDPAAAVVAGVAAMWRQKYPSMTVSQLSAALASSATTNVITGNPASTVNRLLYTRMSPG